MASSAYDVWDARYNRPIVGGKVTNPTTGQVEDAGSMFVAGPPSIQAMWFNVKSSPSSSGWKSGVYSVVSLNASVYSLTVVCDSTATLSEFRQVIRTMRSELRGENEPGPSQANEDAPKTTSEVEDAAQEQPKVGGHVDA
ncbi:hypothetical protein CI238_02652 [Colletotrichum incanum]|uniref:Uncharacterized protein n=1 Tax=Colletotrichum incanum TaxID=1573173 RepID=A0A162NXZ5_COLIC|nr:hypothetical protein CI238_02652 [Colletotrichum incanum]